MAMPWTAYIDGGARGNPGPAGAGVCIQDPSGAVVFAGGFFLGSTTNNQAEYSGLLNALRLLEQAGADEIRVFSDSELMVRQITGQYRVKAPGLKPLYAEAMDRFSRFGKWQMNHVYRENNAQADGLANHAMDDQYDVVATDDLGLISGRKNPAASEADLPGDSSRRVSVLVSVTKPPDAGACEAGLRQGQTFSFSRTVPAGLCIGCCAAVLETVQAMQDSQIPERTARRSCGKPGCGAEFEIRRAI
jgi:uncharacterized repeat protein (TIGR04076 family)